MFCNKRELAKIFGVTEATLTKWQQNGMPFATKRGRENSYDTKQCIEWYVSAKTTTNGDLDPAKQRARKDKEMADKYELENAKLRGELLPAEDVESEWAGIITAAKTAMLAIPSKAAPQLAGVTEASLLEAELTELVREALEEFADAQGQ